MLAASATARAQVPVVAGGVRADGIAALVGGMAPGRGVDVIYESDVELRARIRLAGQSGPLPVGPIAPDVLRTTLDALLGEALIAREAERVRVVLPTRAEVAAERAEIARTVGGAARLRELLDVMGASSAEIDGMAHRRALVSAFLRANLEGTTTVTDAEVERVYASGHHPFVGQPLAEVRESLRAYVAHQALEQTVARWVQVLRARTPVRILAAFGAPAPGGPAPHS